MAAVGRSQPVVGERRGPCCTPSALMSSLAHRVYCHTVREFYLQGLRGSAPRAAQG